MMTLWYDEITTWWHNNMLTWWHDPKMTKMMTWWHNEMISGWHDDMMTWWHDDTVKLWSYIAPQIATYSNDPYTKLKDENDQQFCWKFIIIQCNLPPLNYGRPLHPILAPTRMTYIPSSMMKIANNFVEIASLSSVTYHRQIMVIHCTPNWHLLVWPIYQAQWWKWPTILLK